jgi:hypothetical protein
MAISTSTGSRDKIFHTSHSKYKDSQDEGTLILVDTLYTPCSSLIYVTRARSHVT